MHSLDSSSLEGAKVRFSSPGKAFASHPVDALLVQSCRARGGTWLLSFRVAVGNISRPSRGKTLRVTFAIWALRRGHHYLIHGRNWLRYPSVIPSRWTESNGLTG